MEAIDLIRAAIHAFRLLIAAFFGAIVRLARRAMGKKPRIWRGLSPLIWERYLVLCDRAAGYPSHFLLRDDPVTRELASRMDRVRILGEREGIARDAVHWAALRDLFWWADIIACYFDIMFFGIRLRWATAFVLRMMKICGIKVIVAAHGGDVTYRSPYRARFDWVARVQQNNPAWDLTESTPDTIWRINTYCRYADLVLPCDSAMGRFLPRCDIYFKFHPIDTGELPYAGVSDRARPVVVHAPSARTIKGTEYVLAALDSLRAKGIPFELKLVEKMPREDALKIYADADVIVDQLCIGAYGTLSVEAMALGKPTLTYLDQEHLGDPVYNMPLVNANPENIERVLAVLLRIPELRRRLAKASREATERYQSIEALAPVWDRIYQHVWRGTPLRLEETAHFDPSRKPRAFTEDPSREDFWPIPVSDLAGEIRRAVE